MPLLGEIPGLAEAVGRESFDRLAAYLNVSDNILGIDVQPLTPRLVIELEAAGCPFVCGRVPSAPDLAVFLWHVSLARITPKPWYVSERTFRERQKTWLSQWLVAQDFGVVAKAIQGYIEDANADGPGGGDGSSDTPFASWSSSVVDYIASRYHWDEDKILDTPLKRLWQYWRRARFRDSDGKALFVNRADEVRAKYLENLNPQKGAAA